MVRVAEPQVYEPVRHGKLFEQVITQLVNPSQPTLTGAGRQPSAQPNAFNLLVFPEAFAPTTALLQVLEALSQLGSLGCVHVGLRSASDLENHLMGKAELTTFLDALLDLHNTVAEDLAAFAQWLNRQVPSHRFNIGCLFTIDVEGRIRICLHPKLVRSQFEADPLPERTMAEADLLSVVTLRPQDRKDFAVTIQPLICSDALNLPTDRGTKSPLEELHSAANEFEALPDHVDIVSLATCTPQKTDKTTSGFEYREWHQDFRAAFERAAHDGGLPRHHFASFVLSNFRTLMRGAPGGLSGVFEPISPGKPIDDRQITLSCYGHSKAADGNNRWSTPADEDPTETWRIRAYIAALKPEIEEPDTAITIFSFTLPSIVRANSLWKTRKGLQSYSVSVARWTNPPSIEFANGDLW